MIVTDLLKAEGFFEMKIKLALVAALFATPALGNCRIEDDHIGGNLFRLKSAVRLRNARFDKLRLLTRSILPLSSPLCLDYILGKAIEGSMANSIRLSKADERGQRGILS
jgi:hypothetical protein